LIRLFFKEVLPMPQKRMLLTGGLSLTLRNWPAFVWTYGFNVALALLFSLPLHQQIGDITAHSLAAQRLTGAFDLGTVAEITLKLSKGPGPATHGSYLSIPFYLLLYFPHRAGHALLLPDGRARSSFFDSPIGTFPLLALRPPHAHHPGDLASNPGRSERLAWPLVRPHR